MRKVLLIASIFLLIGSSCFAQILRPAKWQYELSKKEVRKGETVDLIFRATIDEGWYMYSSDFDPDLGPITAEFTFEPHKSYELVGGIKPVGAKKKYSEIFEGDYTYFSGKAEFRQTVKIKSDNPQIKTEFGYQVCSDKDGKCVNLEEDHTFRGIKVLASAEKKEPTESPSASKENKQPETSKETNTGKSTTAASSSTQTSARLQELEKEKKKLSGTNKQGKDETVEYLKNFVRKHGGEN